MHIQTAISDIETNGLLPELDTVHCISVREYETGKKFNFRKNEKEDTIEEGLDLLEKADRVVFHNGIAFDLPALEKVYPGFSPKGIISDSLVLSRVLMPEIEAKDYDLYEEGLIPGGLLGRHGLEAWGYRVGLHKGDYAKIMEAKAKERGITDPKEIIQFVWGSWSPFLESYCDNDIAVTGRLWERLLVKLEHTIIDPIILEHEVADLMVRIEHNGFPFDVEACRTIVNEMANLREPIREKCKELFPGKYVPSKTYKGAPREEFGEKKYVSWANRGRWWGEITSPKKTLNYKKPIRADRVEGVPFCEIKWEEFNPGSRPQVFTRLMEMGWKPNEFTDTGNPKVNDVTLRRAAEQLPIAGALADHFMIQKRLGQAAEGDKAWLLAVTPEGKIHGAINPHGAVTGRAAHYEPNLAQVPKVVYKDKVLLRGFEGGWGYECRDLFFVPPPFVLMGCDLSGIELRCLAHYMSAFDGGEYAKILLEGDIHTVNMEAAGLNDREQAKTFIYAFIYGAGDEKIGSIAAPLADADTQAKIGKALKARFLSRLPALREVFKSVKKQARHGWIIGLDGRKLFVRHQHSALNTLLQSAAAIIAKKWILLFEQYMEAEGFIHSWDGDFAMLAWIHDEIQTAVRKAIAELSGQLCEKAALDAGEQLNFTLPTAAKSKLGRTWAETH